MPYDPYFFTSENRFHLQQLCNVYLCVVLYRYMKQERKRLLRGMY